MSHDHALSSGPHDGPFSPTELDFLHKQDIAAGTAVVVLMCSIFSLGVVIYTIVAFSVAF